MSQKNKNKILTELLVLAENFGESSDLSDEGELEDEGDFVPVENVSELEDELEEVVEEDSDVEGEPDAQYNSEHFVAKSGMKWYGKSKPVTRRYQRNIVTAKPGPTHYVKDTISVKEVFDLLVNDNMKMIICNHTNEEAERDIAIWNSKHPNSPRQWKPLDKTEFDCFIGVLLKAGALRCRRESVHEIWTTDKSIRRSFFVAAMSRDRFYQISRYLIYVLTTKHQESKERLWTNWQQ